jgi:phi13 family phage major tail protein
MAQYVDEFRGTDNLVYAEVTADNNETSGGYVTGTVKVLAPVAEIAKTVETASDTKYYDNKPALTINAEGADTITLTVPALDLATLADITGKTYDTTVGAFMDGERNPKYFALGYRLRLTDGTYRYVWRYKGSFGIPDETSQTENAGTDSNNQQLTYTGIQTMHIFTKPNSSQKALVVDERDGLADLSTFFDTVTTCDTLHA